MFTSWKFHEFCEFLIGDGKNYLMYFSQELSHQIHYTIEHASNHRHQNINTYSYIYTDTSKYLPIYNFRRLLQDKLLLQLRCIFASFHLRTLHVYDLYSIYSSSICCFFLDLVSRTISYILYYCLVVIASRLFFLLARVSAR